MLLGISYFGGGVSFWRSEAFPGALYQDIALYAIVAGGFICYLLVFIKCSFIRGPMRTFWDSRGLFCVVSSVLITYYLAPELILRNIRFFVYALTSCISVINVFFIFLSYFIIKYFLLRVWDKFLMRATFLLETFSQQTSLLFSYSRFLQ